MKKILLVVFFLINCSSIADVPSKKLTILPELTPAVPFQQSVTGKDFNSKLSGRIIIHYWASWCGTCVSEISELMQFVHKHRDQLDKIFIVSLDIDLKKYSIFWAKLLGDGKKQWDYPNVYSLTDLKSKLPGIGITMVPETYFFNQGRLVRRIIGTVHWGEESLLQFIKGAL